MNAIGVFAKSYRFINAAILFPLEFVKSTALLSASGAVGFFVSFALSSNPIIQIIFGTASVLCFSSIMGICFRIIPRGESDDSASKLEQESTINKNLKTKLDSMEESLVEKQTQIEAMRRRGISIIEAEKEFIISTLKLRVNEVVPVTAIVEKGKVKNLDIKSRKKRKISDETYFIVAARRIVKDVHLGIDINKIRFMVSENKKTIYYQIPEIRLSEDIGSGSCDWEQFMVLEPSRGLFESARKAVGSYIPYDPFGLFYSDDSMPVSKFILTVCNGEMPSDVIEAKEELEKRTDNLGMNFESLKNASGNIIRDIRTRVEKIIRHLGYAASESAKSLPAGKSIGFEELFRLPADNQYKNGIASEIIADRGLIVDMMNER